MRSFKEHVTWVKRKSASLFQAGSARSTHPPPATRHPPPATRHPRDIARRTPPKGPPEQAGNSLLPGLSSRASDGIEPAFSAWEGAVAPSGDLVFRVFGLVSYRFGSAVCARMGPGLTGCCGTNVARLTRRAMAGHRCPRVAACRLGVRCRRQGSWRRGGVLLRWR